MEDDCIVRLTVLLKEVRYDPLSLRDDLPHLASYLSFFYLWTGPSTQAHRGHLLHYRRCVVHFDHVRLSHLPHHVFGQVGGDEDDGHSFLLLNEVMETREELNLRQVGLVVGL